MTHTPVPAGEPAPPTAPPPLPRSPRMPTLSPGGLTFLVGLVLLLAAGITYQQSLLARGLTGTTAEIPAAPAAGTVKYVCPMRCVELDEPGRCPVCGMDTFAIEVGGAEASAAAGSAGTASGPADPAGTATTYTCPMHPQIVQDRPGTCPICAMELVPQRTTSDSQLDVAALEGLALSPTQEVLANVTPVQPVREGVALSVPAIGEVTVPQDQVREVVAWQDGRVDELRLATTGGFIADGAHILDLYSEELVQAQNEYLIALKAMDELGDSAYDSIARGTRALLEASRTRLIREGMTAEQLLELEQTRRPLERVPVYARQSGIVMEKNVTEGQYVAKGSPLYTVAALDPIWVEVQLFEHDAAGVRVGDRVKLKSPSEPGRTYSGTVQVIEPRLDSATRTFRLRVQVDNADLSLRPGMLLDAQIEFDYGSLLLLPRNAVLHTGGADLVYVRAGDGSWAAREVTVGRDFGDRVEITAGLSPSEVVAGTAAFLIDSEAQLRGVPRPVD